MKRYTFDGLIPGLPFSHVTEAAGLLFVSGMVPVDLINEKIEMDDIGEATRMVMENIRYALEKAGSSLDRIVKTTVYLRDMSDFDAFNVAYEPFFPSKEFPARSCVAVKEIAANLPIEIDVIAER